jgi:uncharacterized repeat protein (TIGR03803 family)
VVFAINADGTSYRNLHSFAGGGDGSTPDCLLLSSNVLYGTAIGFSSGIGTVFKVNTNGTGFTILHTFTATNFVQTPPTSAPAYANNEGVFPTGLTLSGNSLYGTAAYGGSWGNGTIFTLKIDGKDFSNLYSFAASSGSNFTNGDGAHPVGLTGLVASGNNLYGTANWGGSSGNGTVFVIKMDGTGFRPLHTFTETDSISGMNADGANPYAGLIFAENTLYGVAEAGGSSGYGTLFSLSLPSTSSQLVIVPLPPNVILTWMSGLVGSHLQTTTNLVSPVWTPVLQSPAILNGKNTLTNPISGTQQFFRLSQ